MTNSMRMWAAEIIAVLNIVTVLVVLICPLDGLPLAPELRSSSRQARFQVSIGPCTWIFDRQCPDDDIKFFLYTRKNKNDRQSIHVDESWDKSNISSSYFNPHHPVKIVIHGYNSDMFLSPLIQMKDEYLDRDNYNLFFVDWSTLAPAPCYPSAAQNTRHAGKCIAQLVDRIKDGGTEDVHLIGFSLGAHVTNFVANNVKSFKIPRITGLDPALPLFITAAPRDKLDESDAEFVDIIHSNALVQGKIERCGHADFYMNGGIIQPGCFQSDSNPIACSHHRAPDYFTESIKSERGFWGWSCSSYINYLLGFCPRSDDLHQAGEDCRPNTKGMFMITTNGVAPFASGQWSMAATGSSKNGVLYRRDPLLEQIDEWGKLEGDFNYRGAHTKHPLAGTTFDWAHLNQIENELGDVDKLKFNVNDEHDGESHQQTISTERWRQNDKFRLQENPLLVMNNDSLSIQRHHSHLSDDDFQFPKVTY